MKGGGPPFLIGICGAGSGSGKTNMAQELLRRSVEGGIEEEKKKPPQDEKTPPAQQGGARTINNCTSSPEGNSRSIRGPWGVIKFTKTGLYTSVITDTDVLLEEGKDTARVLKAGARRAVWICSPGGADLEEALSMALGELHECGVVVVEGNSAVELLKPDIVIFMSGPFFKSGAETALREADIVFRPEGAILPAGAGAIKKGAVFCGSLQLCAGEVFKRMAEREGKGTA